MLSSRAWALSCLLLVACSDGRIGVFAVTPNPACRGEPVYISYGADEGSPVLSAEPAIPGFTYDPRNRFGVVTITAEADTTFRFEARGSRSSDRRSITLVVKDPSEAVQLAPTGTCPGLWRQSLTGDQWPSNAVATRVTNLEPSTITVTHDGVSATLTAAGSATASTASFDGRPLVGDWDLRGDVGTRCPPGCGMTTPCPTLPALHAEVTWRCAPR
jgi:hypothetical protein